MGKKKDRQVLSMPIYIVVEEDALVMPNVTAEIITPSQLPSEGMFYALTASGMKISKDTSIIKALAPAKNCAFLADVTAVPKLRLPKIRPLITARAWRFFQKVYEKHKTESELMLLYNAQEKRYDLWCPNQEVSMAGVKYDMSKELADTPPEWQWVGTYHSHANFDAYHSNIDHDDEQDEDGVHITIGHVKEDYCSISASVMIGGERWKLPAENILLGLERVTAAQAKRQYYISTKNQEDSFQVALSGEELAIFESECEEQIDQEWFPRVTHKIYTGRSNWTYQYEYDDDPVFDEEEEKGQWELVNGHWKFIEDATDDDFDPTNLDTYHDPNGVTEQEKDEAIGSNVVKDDNDDDGQTDD